MSSLRLECCVYTQKALCKVLATTGLVKLLTIGTREMKDNR